MDKLTNPLIWLLRFRHRCGYGVHSPFAFHFLMDVVYETTPYYIYEDLDPGLSFQDRFRVKRGLHLLMRCANYWQPQTIVAPDATQMERWYLEAGCRHSQMLTSAQPGDKALYYLKHSDVNVIASLCPGCMLIMDNLRQNRTFFQSLPSTVSMDLYDLGIAFFDTNYNKQHYIVNF